VPTSTEPLHSTTYLAVQWITACTTWLQGAQCTCSGMLYPNSHTHPQKIHRSGRNTQLIDTCVVFSQWHIHSHFQFFLSFLAIVGLGVLYEYLRMLSRDFDRRIAVKMRTARRTQLTSSGRSSPERSDAEETGLLHGVRAAKKQGCV